MSKRTRNWIVYGVVAVVAYQLWKKSRTASAAAAQIAPGAAAAASSGTNAPASVQGLITTSPNVTTLFPSRSGVMNGW